VWGIGSNESQTQMTLVFFHKNKFILTEFPWLVKDLQRNCQAKVEMSCSYQDRNVLFFRSEILGIFLCCNGGS
jgi:hypothetical protein